MLYSVNTPARKYSKGMGKAVADRTINRKVENKFKRPKTMKIDLDMTDFTNVADAIKAWSNENGYITNGHTLVRLHNGVAQLKIKLVGAYEVEEWEDVANRVAKGNASLSTDALNEETGLRFHLRKATMLMSGRHLQHSDESMGTRNQEVFTNCSTSAASFLTFYLLLNGSGVGRSYDDSMMMIDWSKMPTVLTVLDKGHADILSGEIMVVDRASADHLYASKKRHYFDVPDTREGWAKAIEKIETMAFLQSFADDVLIIDFSKVRPRGSPIAGMQGRPASGPGPLITAINNVARVKSAGMKPWKQALYIDHYLAECVLVGGARRAARMSTKYWKDADILEFISVKKGGFLWSSNNSVTVDEQFWELQKIDLLAVPYGEFSEARKAQGIFESICHSSYHDGTGEPGIINADRLSWNDENVEVLEDGNYAESQKYKLDSETLQLTKHLVQAWKSNTHKAITNPCGEIVLGSLGGYCVIADVVPYHAKQKDLALWDIEVEDAFRTSVRALIRTNTLDSLYHKEVARTNRIGVGMTGLHEYAWARFGYGWKELINEEASQPFWQMLSRFKRAVDNESTTYSKKLGLNIPHTNTTMKPAGTTSKLFALSEGAHLPSMREFLRWVQFRNDDPLVEQYKTLGYPVRKLQVYKGTTVVGFPTQPEICRLGMGDRLRIAAEATPEEQYIWLTLLEKYWIIGVQEDGVTLQTNNTGNQVSYTLKYNPKIVDYEHFKAMILKYQPTIKCCSVMPNTDASEMAYEYLPEHAVTKHEYEQIVNAIKDDEIKEDVGIEHVSCDSGACPIDFK